jgi:hypothetical protein
MQDSFVPQRLGWRTSDPNCARDSRTHDMRRRASVSKKLPGSNPRADPGSAPRLEQPRIRVIARAGDRLPTPGLYQIKDGLSIETGLFAPPRGLFITHLLTMCYNSVSTGVSSPNAIRERYRESGIIGILGTRNCGFSLNAELGKGMPEV